MQKPWHSFSIEKTFREFKTRPTGLTEIEVKERLKKFGWNRLPKEKPFSGLKLFFSQFESPLIYLLVVAGLVTLFFQQYIDMAVIFGAVVLNVCIGYIQENKASQALAKLKKVIRDKAVVIRQSHQKEINTWQIVPGDIIILRPGDRVPADGRLIAANHLKINEAALTGEWLAADKETEILDQKVPLADRDNLVYMGTIVEEGRGQAVVTATRTETEFGRIALLIRQTKEAKTPFQKKLAHLARLISAIIALICLIILVIGLVSGHSFVEMFMTAVAIAIAAIPEGLPVGMTVILAIGMRRILKKKGLVRNLLGAETLGSTSIICTDKTGTLTKGEMSVSQILPAGSEKNQTLILKIAALCNEAFIENPEESMERWIIRGRPTDRALLLAAVQAGLDGKTLESQMPRLDWLPFSPERKYLASLHQIDRARSILYLSGAPERILATSNYLEVDGHSEKLTTAKIKELKEKYERLTQPGLRVLAVGYRKFGQQRQKTKIDLEKDFQELVFVGFIALSDPLRPEVKEAIQTCSQAGLKPIIVTGDHRLTVKAVAEELGFKIKKENILEGQQLDLLSDERFNQRVKKIDIYARVEPKHKMRIVQAWQNHNQVVAMTGDGVNDAPALKKADIGVAVESGTDVAKEASDLILLQDNFSVMVAAVEQGRVILDNIKKIIVYLLSDSFSEIILIGGSLLLGFPLPLIPAQILLVNLLADGLPNFALAFEPKEKDIMKQKPRPAKAPLLSQEMKILITIMGLVTALILLALFLWLWWSRAELCYIRTMVFAALGVDSLFYVFACKSLRQSIWQINLFSNRYLIGTVLFGFLLMGLAIHLPIFQMLLRTISLGFQEWLIIFGIGLLNIIAIETAKWFLMVRKFRSKVSPKGRPFG